MKNSKLIKYNFLQEKEEVAKKIYSFPREKIPLGRDPFPLMTWPGTRPHLSSFVTGASWLLFDLAEAHDGMEWLQIPAELWHKFESYKRVEAFAEKLPVTNDCAERAMSMIKTFIDGVKDEGEKQDLLQVVQEWRRNIPDLSKESLSKL